MVKHIVGLGVVAVLVALGACNSDSDDSGTCSTLTTCCSQLADADNKTICTETVAKGDDGQCADTQASFEELTLCKMPTSTGPGTTTYTGCAGLTSCCGVLPAADQSTCEAEVSASAGTDGTCNTYISVWQEEGQCKNSTTVTTGGTGCAGLTSCCASLTGTNQSTCEEEVSVAAGTDATCTVYLDTWSTECGGGTVITTPDAGTPTGTDCADLSSCCSTLTGEDATECNTEVTAAAGVEASCSEYLTTWQDAEMCGGGTVTVDAGTPDTGTPTGGGCSALSTCCGMLDSTEQAGCNDIVNEGVDATCSADLTAYEDDSLCD